MARRVRSEGCAVDMTPMIDVVFQLIIFFIVTIKMDERKNEDIRLEEAKHGPAIEKQDPKTLIVEVDQHGWISIHGAQLSPARFQKIMAARYQRYGQFPILIRGDYRTEHRDIRAVMDICTRAGIWRINFAAIKERKNEA